MGKLSLASLKKVQTGKSLKTKVMAMEAINFTKSNLAQILVASEKQSKSDFNLTTKAILLRSQTGDAEEAFELAQWSVKANPTSRKEVVKSFISSKQSSLFVHHVAQLKMTDAKTMMKEYFTNGGDMKDVAEWLAAAGNILKTGTIPDDTDGRVWNFIKKGGKAIKKGAAAVKDAVVGAINTMADAVVAAGKNLANTIAKVASWTQSKISDFVEAVLKTSKRVASILSEAAKKGAAVLNKFIQAVIEAGKRGLEVINWALTKTQNILQIALAKLEKLFGSFTSVLRNVAQLASSKFKALVRALLANGKKVLDFINRLDRLAYNIAKKIVEEIRRAGKTVKEIMNTVIGKTRAVARIVLDALNSLGNNIHSMLKVVANKSVNALKTIIGALKDLGKSLNRVLNHIARFVGNQLRKLMKALRMIWTKVTELLEAIAKKSILIIKNLLTALLGTGLHIRNVLKSIIQNVRAAFRKGLIKGLLEIGKSALTLMKEAAKISLSSVAVLFGILMHVMGKHRGLTKAERKEAKKVFGNSIDLDRVQITNASFAADFVMWVNGGDPFTTMYVITYHSKKQLKMRTIIHELAHIWQAEQSGGVYMIEALHSQFFGKKYNLANKDLIKANGDINKLEREQQAVLIEEYWMAEFGGVKSERTLDLDLMRPMAKQVFKGKFKILPHILTDFKLDPAFKIANFNLNQ